MKTKHERRQQEDTGEKTGKSPDAYGKAKKDMGGYIGERSTAGDESNPESLPGGA